MSKGRFINQKLGKRMNRNLSLKKAKLSSQKAPAARNAKWASATMSDRPNSKLTEQSKPHH